MTILRKLGIGIAVLLALPILIFSVLSGIGRFADGPIVEFLPGGPLESGEWIETEPDDWSFVADIEIIELESDGRSRKTWILTDGESAYVPASLSFPPFKTWHEKALEEPDAVVRIAGKRYRRSLQKIDDPALEAMLAAQVRSKYGGPPTEGAGAWFFRLDPRD